MDIPGGMLYYADVLKHHKYNNPNVGAADKVTLLHSSYKLVLDPWTTGQSRAEHMPRMKRIHEEIDMQGTGDPQDYQLSLYPSEEKSSLADGGVAGSVYIVQCRIPVRAVYVYFQGKSGRWKSHV
jgi:hypothetical protein